MVNIASNLKRIVNEMFNRNQTKINASNQYQVLCERILNSGSDNVKYFGGEFQGGYKLQQNVHEFASLVKLLRNYFKDNEIKHYLEIGSASGGNLRFMYENLGFRYVTSLDDGQHTEALLVKKYSKNETLYIFHDTIACQKDGVGEAWKILLNNHNFYTLEHFVGNEKPMGIAVCKCKKSNQ